MCLCSFYSFFNLSFSNLVHQDKLNENRYCFPGIKQFFFFFVKVLKYKMFFDLTSIYYKQQWPIWWPILGICALRLNPSTVHTHSSEHTKHMNTHPEQWAAIYVGRRPGKQFGVWVLFKGHLSREIEGGERVLYIHPPAYNSCRSEIRTRNLSITNPTH